VSDLVSDLQSGLLRKIIATPSFIRELFIGLSRSGMGRAELYFIDAVTGFAHEMAAHLNNSGWEQIRPAIGLMRILAALMAR